MRHTSITPRTAASKAAALARSLRSSAWERMREKNALALFRKAAKQVPAYREFLKKHGIIPSAVRTWKDMAAVPATSKANYLREYQPHELCWGGSLVRPAVYSSTSGSTGKPFYFQRSGNLEEEYSAILELFLANGAYLPSAAHPTLVIVGFGMGVWIGGMLTYRAYEIVSHRSYPVSILPAGVNKKEILSALRDLASEYTQTILIGYPPFIKDILDEAESEGIDLSALNLRLQFAAESFTEQFRDYLGKKAGIKNVLKDTFNVYGTSDIGAMAFETPVAILVRRLAVKHPALFEKLFGNTKKTPTLAQYNPAYMTFEATEEGDILLTGNSAVPLIRYAVGDHGGVHSFEEVLRVCKEEGVDLRKEAHIHDIPVYEMPFVYVYERSDLATTLYGLQIFPQYVKDVLLSDDVQEFLTGKFQLITKFDAEQNQYLEIHLEMKKGVTEVSNEFSASLTQLILASMLEKSSEFRELTQFVNSRPLIGLEFHEAGNPEFFPAGIKQKWVKKAGE